jgi:hypothetical protein
MNAQPSYTALLEPRLRSFPQPEGLKAFYEPSRRLSLVAIPTVVFCAVYFLCTGPVWYNQHYFFDRLFLIKMNRDRS